MSINHHDSSSHIVVVNDTQEILDLFREILEDEGYRVSLYSFAFSEIDAMVELAPDLVILDFMIGGESHGWQLLQKMKMDRRTATIPVIVCTAALSLVRDIEGHLRAKHVGVVLKPFDIDELVDEVRKFLKDGFDASAEAAHSST
ncbi:MAG TPA: response regulator [Thermomicrobiales bacterium]|jgi:DNA-binding response OmpR family regulator|nr:response regulator [Thermomicrobiales bacterium]